MIILILLLLVYEHQKISIQLNTSVNPNSSITVRSNNNIVNTENILTTLEHTSNINSNDNIYKLNHKPVYNVSYGTLISGSKNSVDNTNINFLGSDNSTLGTETRNGSSYQYLNLKNYFYFTGFNTKIKGLWYLEHHQSVLNGGIRLSSRWGHLVLSRD